MTYAHVGYITKFLWGQRRPPENSEIEESTLSKYLIPYQIISTEVITAGGREQSAPSPLYLT